MSAFPALGFDPAPGSPDVVARLGRDTTRVAGELAALGRDLQRLDAVGADWRGEAASCFRASLGELPRHLRRAEESFAAAARELSGWSAELADLQSQARAAEGDAADALVRLRAARSAASGVPTADDPLGAARAQAAAREAREAEAALERARARARDIRHRAQDAAARVERAVREAARTAPPEPGIFERIGDSLVDGVQALNTAVGDWVRENADTIAAVTDVLSTVAFVAGFVPGVGTGTMLALNGLALLGTASLAAYTDRKDMTDVALAGAGLVLGGAGAVAERAAVAARADELGQAVTRLPSMFTPGLVMGQRELVWRSVQLQPTLAGHAIGIVDMVGTARDRGLLPPQGGHPPVVVAVRSTEPGRAPLVPAP